MMNDIVTIDTNNFAAMAKAMGISDDSSASTKKASILARFRISHTPIMGTAEVNGKQKNVEVVEGGSFKLEIPDGQTYYATSVKLRPYAQRFMYKRFVMGSGESKNRYIKTIMTEENFKIDLKDNDGGFNCGKNEHWVKDWKALSKDVQDLYKSIKRVRVVLGTVELINPVDEKGASVSVDVTPCIWEVENKEAYNTVGGCFNQFSKMKRLPPQHYIHLVTEPRDLPNGNRYYVPMTKLDMTETLRVEDEHQQTFADFMAWIDNYNSYIFNAWNENVRNKQEVDIDMEEFIDVEDATVQ